MSTLRVLPRNRLLVGDALQQLPRLPEGSVDMVLTSPPYFRLRDYGQPGQLGLERHVDDWVATLAELAGQVRRVLVPSGTFWINLGDTYATHPSQGAARKSLMLAPERLALALVADGWRLRNKIVWHKPNRMPTSARDRLASSWEALYVFAKQPSYFFDLDAIRRPHTSTPPRPKVTRPATAAPRESWRGPNGAGASGLASLKARGLAGHPLGKNPGDVWTIPSSNYRGGHHATFPLRLAELAIRAGCPEARCSRCPQPWRRPVLRSVTDLGRTALRGALAAQCDCGVPPEPGLVLDPFIGAGTTALAARSTGRDWLGIELSPAYAAEAEARIASYAGKRGQPARASPAA
ncbi:MAG TPA: site-specific DNA-methyltransferase [Mycobacteriales bacterium]|nr:site-specific DNA-methyltransferase [Mycobacteriales bacterium]